MAEARPMRPPMMHMSMPCRKKIFFICARICSQAEKRSDIVPLVQDHHDNGANHVEKCDDEHQRKDEVDRQIFGIQHFVEHIIQLCPGFDIHLPVEKIF